MNGKLAIIGLSGTNGSGKDTVGGLLAQHHNYLFVSVSDFLREEARKRGLPITREVLRTISTEWRRQFGLGVLVDRAVGLFERSADMYSGVVVCPMRNAAEADHLKQLGGRLLWVDADPRVRYERIQKANRGRSGEDQKTYQEFLAEEQAEMHAPKGADAAMLNMADVKERADIFLENSGGDLKVLLRDIETALGL